MKKLLSVLLFVPLFIHAETVIHENSMCFSNMSLTNYTNVSVNIPSNQQDSTRAKDGTQVVVNGNCIDVYAGRHDSEAVKDWTQTQMENASSKWNKYNMVADGSDSTPDKLNFAINGDLTFNYNNHDYMCNSIVFGQGNSSDNRNNWWVFSNGDFSGQYISFGYTRINCTDTITNQQAPLYLHDTGYDSFEVESTQPAAPTPYAPEMA